MLYSPRIVAMYRAKNSIARSPLQQIIPTEMDKRNRTLFSLRLQSWPTTAQNRRRQRANVPRGIQIPSGGNQTIHRQNENGMASTSHSNRRFFTAFYDAVSPLLRARTTPPPPPRCRSFAATPASPRPALSGMPFAPTVLSWATTRSRYVVSRGFAGLCVCTNVPVGTTASSSATAAATVAEGVGGLKRATKKGIPMRLGLRCTSASAARRRRKMAGVGESDGWSRGLVSQRRGISTQPPPPPPPEKPPPLLSEKQPSATTPQDEESTRSSDDMRGIFERVSHIHRPSKDEMLAAATGVWQRLRIRTKWSLIRQMRPYSFEDVAAFFSWLFLGHVVWIVVGTTTFLSVAIFLVNSVFAQGVFFYGWLEGRRC